MQYFTGSKAHNIHIRGIAKEKGLKLSEYGVFCEDTKVAGKTEEEVYRALGMVWIPPEIREDRGEVELALEGKLPDLVELKNIKGDLHIHSNFSDGQGDIETLWRMAKNVGYEYIAITDHSPSAHYAGGLSVDEIKRRNELIDRINKRGEPPFILKGMEVDILADGSLDLPEDVLGELDVVIASVHQGFRKNVTERMISACQNPYVHIIAHPSGRLINIREGYDVDLERVIESALETGTVLEVNGYYLRLDLDEVYARGFCQRGGMVCLNTDTHQLEMFDYMVYAVSVARRAWLTRENVLNTKSLKELLYWLRHEIRGGN